MCSVLITITDRGGTSFGLSEKVSQLETTTNFPRIYSLSEASSCPTGHCCPGTQAPGFCPGPWCPLEDRGAGKGWGSGKIWLLCGWLAVWLGKQDEHWWHLGRRKHEWEAVAEHKDQPGNVWLRRAGTGGDTWAEVPVGCGIPVTWRLTRQKLQL